MSIALSSDMPDVSDIHALIEYWKINISVNFLQNDDYVLPQLPELVPVHILGYQIFLYQIYTLEYRRISLYTVTVASLQ